MEEKKINGERLDKIGFGNLRLIQRPEDFCYGIDAVILADFASKYGNSCAKAVELGTGNGAAGIIFSHKSKIKKIVLIELQKGPAELAARNVRLNGLENQISIVNKDIKELDKSLNGTVDLVLTNPPYMVGGRGIENTNNVKSIARHETTAGIEDFMKTSAKLLKPRGHLIMVHRPSRLVDIFSVGRKEGLEPKEMRLVCPSFNEKPNIVLVHFIKGGGHELKIIPDLYVRDENNNYTQEINDIYEREK